jgi:hypothetical protein
MVTNKGDTMSHVNAFKTTSSIEIFAIGETVFGITFMSQSKRDSLFNKSVACEIEVGDRMHYPVFQNIVDSLKNLNALEKQGEYYIVSWSKEFCSRLVPVHESEVSQVIKDIEDSLESEFYLESKEETKEVVYQSTLESLSFNNIGLNKYQVVFYRMNNKSTLLDKHIRTSIEGGPTEVVLKISVMLEKLKVLDAELHNGYYLVCVDEGARIPVLKTEVEEVIEFLKSLLE